MSARIRGQEAAVTITVADEVAATFNIFGRLDGSFFKVKDFTATPRTDLVEESYIGEVFDDLDIQHHGYDLSFSIDEEDAKALDFMSLIIFKEVNSLAPPTVGISVSYIYRDTTVLPRTEIFGECVLKMAERTIGGRKEYITNSFEAKAKHRQVLIG